MKKLEPKRTPIPSYIPCTSASLLALRPANMSDAPAAKEINVTPANDYDIFMVFERACKEGLKCSSATYDK